MKELCHEIRELKQQRRRQKSHLKSKYSLHQTFRAYFLFQYVNCWQQVLLEFNSQTVNRSSEKEKESREIRYFYVVSCSDGKKKDNNKNGLLKYLWWNKNYELQCAYISYN